MGFPVQRWAVLASSLFQHLHQHPTWVNITVIVESVNIILLNATDVFINGTYNLIE